jgi:enamine deaminase RidA (YjgF/YER057c/UK114 family)
MRSRVFSGAPWERSVGYCRALRAGPFVAVSGTISLKDGVVFAPGDAYAQARRCLEIIEDSLKELGLGREHVVRTRLFVTDIGQWESIGRAHGEFFASHPPATSMYEVSALIAPEFLIEIEAEAWAPESG